MRPVSLACCKIYVSESRNKAVLDRIAAAAQAALVHSFPDEHYNRVGYTLAGTASGNDLHDVVVHTVEVAIDSIDVREHQGTHPRLGAVDNICFHLLQSAAPPLNSSLAKLAKKCASSIGNRLQVPTYLYGDASDSGRSLVELRRSLGYFRTTSGRNLPPPQPDFGPLCRPGAGIVAVGAAPWIANYNVPLATSDLALGRKIARQVVAGSKALQAMALCHGPGCIEIACNLLDESITAAEDVQARVESFAAIASITVLQGYRTSPSQAETLELAIAKLSSADPFLTSADRHGPPVDLP